jgi:gliding motility associated protien GldN
MKKFNVTLMLILASIAFSYGQVIKSDTVKSSVMEAIRRPVDGTYIKENTETSTPITLTHVREADVYWSELVWRVMDLRLKFNFPYYFPTEPKGNWKSLMQAILDAIDSTEANSNPLRIYTDEYVNIPVSVTEIKNNLGEKKIQKIFNEWGEEVGDTTLFIEFGAKEVFQYVIKEQWKMDKQRSIIYPEIISICPMFWLERLDGGGGESDGGGGGFSGGDEGDDFTNEEEDMPVLPNRRWREFGWIWYPEVRQVFVTTDAFNPQNNAQRRSYDRSV